MHTDIHAFHGCADLLLAYLQEQSTGSVVPHARARTVRALVDTVSARLEPPGAGVLAAVDDEQVWINGGGEGLACTVQTPTSAGSGVPWVQQDGHHLATLVAGTQQVLATARDAADLIGGGRTAAAWAVLDLGGEQLRRLLARTECWEDGPDFPHTAASTRALLDLQRAAGDRGVALEVPAAHLEWALSAPAPTGTWDTVPLPVPDAAGTLAAIRAGVGVARSSVPVDEVTRPDLTREERATAGTDDAQAHLQALLVVDLVTYATCALARFVVGYADSRWEPVTGEVERAAAITSGYLTALVG